MLFLPGTPEADQTERDAESWNGIQRAAGIDTSAVADAGIVSTAFADLNGDGKQDLVFSYQANTQNNGVATLLGNGDGTFAAPVDFTIGSTLIAGSALLAVGDRRCRRRW